MGEPLVCIRSHRRVLAGGIPRCIPCRHGGARRRFVSIFTLCSCFNLLRFSNPRSVQLKRTTRGPPGWVLLSGVLAVTVGSVAYFLRTADDRRYIELAKINERFERAYVLQAVENAAAPRRNKAMLDRERKLMESDPDWIVNQSPYMTRRRTAPAFDEVDPRLFDATGGRE